MDAPNRALQTSQVLSSSLYFWWLAFLRCSKDYWWCCQQRGQCQDPRLVKVYEEFGDIFKYQSFFQWWAANGVRLFDSPQLEMDFVRFLASGIEILLAKDLVKPRAEMVYLAIPMNFDTQAFAAAVLQAWLTARIRGQHYQQDIKYRLHSMKLQSQQTIVPCYRSWALNECVNTSTVSDVLHTWSGHHMGHHLHLSPANRVQSLDTRAVTLRKQSNLRTLFSRNVKDARALIDNVEIGRFPCKAAVPSQTRWSAMQRDELEHAVIQGQWQGRNWMAQEHAFMLPDHDLELQGTNATRKQHVMAALADFGNLATPFLQPKRVRNNKPTTHGSSHA